MNATAHQCWRRAVRKVRGRHVRPIVAATIVLAAALPIATRSATEPPGEWRSYAATNAGDKYAPLDQINEDTVKDLRIAWRQSSMPPEVRRG